MANLVSEVTVQIDRPVDDVFDFVSDPTKMPLWLRYVAEARYTDNSEPRVGATFDLKYTYGSRVNDITMEVTGFDPPVRYAYTTVKGPYPISVTYTLDPEGRGTRFRYVQDARSDSYITDCMFAMLGFLLKFPTRGLLSKNAQRMKAAIEAARGHDSQAG